MKKMNPEDKKINITICLSKDTIKKLGMISDINNRSKSSMIETLIIQEYYFVLENEELFRNSNEENINLQSDAWEYQEY